MPYEQIDKDIDLLKFLMNEGINLKDAVNIYSESMGKEKSLIKSLNNHYQGEKKEVLKKG